MTTPVHTVIDFSKLIEQVKLPGFDMASVIETQRKNIDALTAANQLAYDGMQALMQKHSRSRGNLYSRPFRRSSTICANSPKWRRGRRARRWQPLVSAQRRM